MKIFLFSFLFVSLMWAEFKAKSIQELKNTNFVRQNYEESCGAASLANVLNFYSFKQFGEKEILEFLRQKTDMLSFAELKSVAMKMGYESEGFLLERAHLNEISTPLLVKIENDPRFPHFVVVLNQKGDFVRILDPNFGAYTASKKEFFSVWDKDKKGGYALIILPKDFQGFKGKKPHFFSTHLLDKIKVRF